MNQTSVKIKSVGVVMPTFNSERYIKYAIESVLNQSVNNWRLYIVDGGSSDKTVEIANSFARNDNRITLINNENDQGPAHARSIGIKTSEEEYIAFLDADDVWSHKKIEYQIQFMDDRLVKFSYTRYQNLTHDGKYLGNIVYSCSRYTYKSLLLSRGIGTSTVMLHRSILTDSVISNNMRGAAEDLLWWLRILKSGETALLLDKVLTYYRDTPGSASKMRMRNLRAVFRVYHDQCGLNLITTIFSMVIYIFWNIGSISYSNLERKRSDCLRIKTDSDEE